MKNKEDRRVFFLNCSKKEVSILRKDIIKNVLTFCIIMIKCAAFLLIKTRSNSYNLLNEIRLEQIVVWGNVVYGPYQIVAYVESNDEKQLSESIEKLRTKKDIVELDARLVKIIPKDEELTNFKIRKEKSAVLLINVDYKEQKERIVTWNLRNLKGVVWARAMWGPADIIAIIESDNHNSIRDLICDEVKIMKGVKTNSTLFCYSGE